MLDTANYTPRLKSQYHDTIRAAMKEEFGYKNDMQIPRLGSRRCARPGRRSQSLLPGDQGLDGRAGRR